MNLSSIHGSNRLIRKTIFQMYPGSFAAALTAGIALMVDTLLAGFLLGQEAIAAVAIGTPVIGIFQALTQMVISGAAIKMAVFSGRNDRNALNRAFSLGIGSAFVLGIVFIGVCLWKGDMLANMFGGAGNPAVSAQAAIYLKAGSVCILMGSINMFLSKILALYGRQTAILRAAIIAMLGNVVFSILYIRLLPMNYAIAGLGAGTWTGGFLAILSSLWTIRAKKIPVRFRLKDMRLKELPEMIRHGFPTSGNNLADGVVSGLINNIIVSGFGGDTTALSIYTAVKGVHSFASTPAQGCGMATIPLMGVLYGSRDKTGLRRTVRESYRIGLIASVIWAGVILAALPLLARFYSMSGVPQFRTGVIVCLCFLPLLLAVRIMTQVFEATEKVGFGLAYSILPDSVIYPLLLLVLLPKLGYMGIWLSYAANALPFLLLLYLLRSLGQKSVRFSVDRMLALDKSIRDNVPMLDISIQSSNRDVTGISEQVHHFLSEQQTSRRAAYMTALCLEELAADFVAHMSELEDKSERTIMDIKLFSDEDCLRIILRNAAKPYNPLDFDLDENTFAKVGVKLAQRAARKIDYNYVYKMNIVTIEVDKKTGQ